MTTAGGGPVRIEELGHGQAQDEPVDDGHPVEGPADRGGGDAALGLLLGGDGVLEQGADVGVGRARRARRATVTGSSPFSSAS